MKDYRDRITGIQVINVGLGPALITKTTVKMDGEPVGQWDHRTFQALAEEWPAVPKMYALFEGVSFPVGACEYLIHLDEYDEVTHAWFWEIVAQRLTIEIEYESFYGGENFKAVPPPT
ncbi:hypothetical protein [Streptomyces sp. NPDC021562]|uniref:hypothetical protein n=1 Tax=Streptomyces sp. NPDC021562 TaxID=3155121 RepID=UPI0033FE2E03